MGGKDVALLAESRSLAHGRANGHRAQKRRSHLVAPPECWSVYAAFAFFSALDGGLAGGFGAAFFAAFALSFAANSCLTLTVIAATSTL